MKYAKQILAVVMVVSFCAWYGVGASSSSTLSDENPVAVAQQATGVSFQPKVETITGGEINWTRGMVYAVGVGKARADLTGRRAELMARRGAYVVAARNAALVLAGVRVGPGGRFENVRNGRIQTNVVLTGFHELGGTYDSATRTATVRMAVPLCGIRGVVSILGLEGQKAKRSWSWPKATDVGSSYDVIVIDARGLSCRPAVLLRIASGDGQCVFDAAEYLSDGVLYHPAACYAGLSRTITIPRQADRNWRRCLTIKASRIDADGAIVLDQVNLDILTCAPDAQRTLRQGKLVIVTDE